MLNYNSILILCLAVSGLNGAALQFSESKEADINRYYSLAMNPDKGLAIRIAYADKLLKLNFVNKAEEVYNHILTDPRIHTDLEIQLLALEGLAKCGNSAISKAILGLMSIVSNPKATDQLKASARKIISEIEAALK